MICSECKEKGDKSIVYPGTSSTTLLYCQPFYDGHGKYHHHDLNTTTTAYKCSNGHSWITKSEGECWCGWDNY